MRVGTSRVGSSAGLRVTERSAALRGQHVGGKVTQIVEPDKVASAKRFLARCRDLVVISYTAFPHEACSVRPRVPDQVDLIVPILVIGPVVIAGLAPVRSPAPRDRRGHLVALVDQHPAFLERERCQRLAYGLLDLATGLARDATRRDRCRPALEASQRLLD